MKGSLSFKHLVISFLCMLFVTVSTQVFSEDEQSSDSSVVTMAAININTANVDALAEVLNGVGLKKAQAIVAYREAHGKFSSIDELVNVKGIGEATLAKNRTRMTVD